MPVIKKHKLIFQHLPKTGGTSICNYFNADTIGHQHMNWYLRHLDEERPDGWPEQWASFSVLRHPVERFASAWQMYREMNENNVRPGWEKFLSIKNKYSKLFALDNIDDFVETLCLPTEGENELFSEPDGYHFWSILSFFATTKASEIPAGEVGYVENPNEDDLDFNLPSCVLSYEQLDKDFEDFSKLIGFKNTGLPRKNNNKTGAGDIVRSMSDVTKSRIRNTFHWDFRICNTLLVKRHVSLFV